MVKATGKGINIGWSGWPLKLARLRMGGPPGRGTRLGKAANGLPSAARHDCSRPGGGYNGPDTRRWSSPRNRPGRPGLITPTPGTPRRVGLAPADPPEPPGVLRPRVGSRAGVQNPMSALNPNHKRAILHAFLDVDHLLPEMETARPRSRDDLPFGRYVNDLTSADLQVIHDEFVRIRAAMLARLNEADIPLDIRRTSLRWFLQGQLVFASVVLEETGPKQLKGYGP